MIKEIYSNNKARSLAGRRFLIGRPVDRMKILKTYNPLPEILFITTYPPRECGIATYSQDLIRALNDKFSHSFNISICPLESENEQHIYPSDIKYILNTAQSGAFSRLAASINANPAIMMVMIQHEFGLFENKEEQLKQFLETLTKPVILVFHTVLPNPDESFKKLVQQITGVAASIIVMTRSSQEILIDCYAVPRKKITVIPHGTHLVPHSDKDLLKKKYQLSGKKVLSTFGLLSSGKSIETTLEALPAIIESNPDIIFLIIGKTHPTVIKQQGYQYRNMLDQIVRKLQLQEHVRYINYYLPLPELLEYLQLTDIYLFTSKDPNQAVSGTFSYALSCGCPIVSTPIPHAREVLGNDAGIIIDFGQARQLADAVIGLLNDESLRKNISLNGLHRMAPTAWENAAIAHALLFENIGDAGISLKYKWPVINLDHIKKMTTGFGMIQFSRINEPDICSGYTLDDNARALIVMCQHFELTKDETDITYIRIYFNFIKHCLHLESYFLNYVNEQRLFTEQNNLTNLADATGRAIWALGYLISMSDALPGTSHALGRAAESIMQMALKNVNKIHSARAMAFIIKGLYYRNIKNKSAPELLLLETLADRLLQMYRHEAEHQWLWFEGYLTYANSILPEAMLCAWLASGKQVYKDVAKSSFDFLLSKTFRENNIKVISNKTWLHKEDRPNKSAIGGEQPIDVAYTIIALHKFYTVFKDKSYLQKMETSFNWFLGSNHLHQIIYNPCTGGCYDGLEENYVNLNQGAESTVSYLMARLVLEKNKAGKKDKHDADKHHLRSKQQVKTA